MGADLYREARLALQVKTYSGACVNPQHFKVSMWTLVLHGIQNTPSACSLPLSVALSTQDRGLSALLGLGAEYKLLQRRGPAL